MERTVGHCELCGAPTQPRVTELEPAAGGSLGATVLVEHCTSLLCPSNLEPTRARPA